MFGFICFQDLEKAAARQQRRNGIPSDLQQPRHRNRPSVITKSFHGPDENLANVQELSSDVHLVFHIVGTTCKLNRYLQGDGRSSKIRVQVRLTCV